MPQIIHMPPQFMRSDLPPVTPESIARAKAAADKERAEFEAVERVRNDYKLELSHMLDVFGADVVRDWIRNWERMVSPSTAGDPRR
jgi:hypothetical protein